MTEANIYILQKSPWQKAFPKLLEQVVSRNNRIHVFCDDENFMKECDDLLWTFEQLAFLTHANANDPLPMEQPILLSTAEDILNKANILAITGAKLPSNAKVFDKIILMVQEDDRIAYDKVKTHIKGLESQAIKCNFFKQSATGSWERTSSIR